ncbi:MAG: hypothetical protein IJB27_04160 [Clostridia bacterium]|nr:hypothetical protein [Clostridia bacterium]
MKEYFKKVKTPLLGCGICTVGCIVLICMLFAQLQQDSHDHSVIPTVVGIVAGFLFLLLLAALKFAIFQDADTTQSRKFATVLSIVTIGAILLTLTLQLVFFQGVGKTDPSLLNSKKDKITCSSCGKSYSEGSDDYSSIIRSKFCIRCHDNFTHMMDATDSW